MSASFFWRKMAMTMKIQIVSLPGVTMRRKQDLRRNVCLKNGEHVPAFSNSGVYWFPERGAMCGFCPLYVGHAQRGGG